MEEVRQVYPPPRFGGQAAPAPGIGMAPAQAAPAPAVGGAAPVGPASSWSINDMVTYLDAIALGHLNPTIREKRA